MLPDYAPIATRDVAMELCYGRDPYKYGHQYTDNEIIPPKLKVAKTPVTQSPPQNLLCLNNYYKLKKPLPPLPSNAIADDHNLQLLY